MEYCVLNIIERAKKLGIETNLTKRWENGVNHHPKSIDLFKAIEDIDFCLCSDYFQWKSGGDGDNGESLMYEMDIYFEVIDKENI